MLSDVAGTGTAGRRHDRDRVVLVAGVAALVVLAVISTFVGVSSVTPAAVLRGDDRAVDLLLTSRLPRTAAVVLAGSSMAVMGLTMQALTRNRFVAPSTAGTLDAAVLGLVVVSIVAPSSPIVVKMLVAVGFALAGTGVFLLLLQRLRFTDIIVVPLVGLMLGAVLNAAAVFLAYREGLLQTLITWISGDFSGTLAGRYELLYIVGALSLVTYWYAERFTLAGLGRDFAVNLGLDHGRTVLLGLVLVAASSAVVVVVVGELRLLGLVVPNLVTLILGDRLRRVLPVAAVAGAVLLLAADIGSRTVRHPFEVPVGVVLGVVGGVGFLALLVRRRDALA